VFDDAMRNGDVTAAADGTVAIGGSALAALVSGAANTAVGYRAGTAVTAGYNVLVGFDAGLSITSGEKNIMIGAYAGDGFDGESANIAIGYGAFGGAVNGADKCIAIGSDALKGAVTQDGTIAIGHDTLDALTTGKGNTAVGYQTLSAITDSPGNVAIGYQALKLATSADGNNIAIGSGSMSTGTGGYYNVCIGTQTGTGFGNANVGGCVLIGYQTGDAINSTDANGNISWRIRYGTKCLITHCRITFSCCKRI
jgi:hypothetical protein